MRTAYEAAVHLLARREHGAYELIQKLQQKGFSASDAEEAVAKCQVLRLQSDERFAESLCRTRVRQGYGPVRIQQELNYLQVERNLVEAVLEEAQVNWLELAIAAKNKKYRDNEPLTFKAMQKQKQFLHQRGFPSSVIQLVFEGIKVV